MGEPFENEEGEGVGPGYLCSSCQVRPLNLILLSPLFYQLLSRILCFHYCLDSYFCLNYLL